MESKRAVITGIGAVTPIGNNVEDSWKNIVAGKHGFAPVTKIDTTDLKVTIGGEVKDFEYADKREARRMDLFVQYGITAAGEALNMSGLVSGENITPERLAVYGGSGIGGITTLEREIVKAHEHGPKRVTPLLAPLIITNMLAGQIAIKYQAKGTALGIVTACATGTDAIGQALFSIRRGEADAVIADAAEAPFALATFAGFENMTAMSKSDDPDRASIPFDRERSGFIMGEGAGALIIEELEHAKARGAVILAELVGYGSTCDAFHITQPEETGEGAANAIRLALENAGIRPEEVSYINAHGTSTPYNDLVETRAVKTVFGEHAYKTPMSSTKSMTGHLLGAAGSTEAVYCVKAINEGIIPPTIGYKERDEALDLDYVTEGSRKMDVNVAMSNSLGFGGHNASIIIRKYR
ncbi:MAG: beta-ketoacyl-ACP synthase II [Clostridiales Family XIII bacterium]|jgi:3-oxoacyl-[acyl-carrier-protein] synthase II|nr:beta-ketoacyl-ACP synthase II [Clostridiales Family XIII bacterium]